MGKPQNQSADEPDDGEIDFFSDWGEDESSETVLIAKHKSSNRAAEVRYGDAASILQRIVWHPDAGPREKLLTLQLYDIYGDDEFEIERGVLAAELDMSVQQITKLLAKMKINGLIDWERAYSEHGGVTRIRHVIGCVYKITA